MSNDLTRRDTMAQHDKALATTDATVADLAPVHSLPSEGEWRTIMGMAAALVPTGFLPKAIDTPAKAAAVMLKSRELGVPPMCGLSNIAIINGKPVAGAELMMALVKRAYGRDTIWVDEDQSNERQAVIGYLRHGEPHYYTYTWEMAQKAELTNSMTYRKFPGIMLKWRGVSVVCKQEFPEVIGGLYVPGELGDPVEVNEDGVVVSMSPAGSAPVSTKEAPQRAIAQNTTPSTQRQPRRVTAEIVEDDDDDEDDAAEVYADWQQASAGFHATLNDAGIDEPGKRAWLRYKGFDSTKDVPADTLRAWAKQIREKPDNARAFIEGQIAAQAETEAAAEQAGFSDELMPGADVIPDYTR